MNQDIDEFQRTPGDFILFGMVFAGFVAGMVGLVTACVPVGVTGVLLMLIGLGGFIIKGLIE